MRIKNTLLFIVFVGMLTTCLSQHTNFSSIYDSQELFKMRKQIPANHYGDYTCHYYLVTKAEEGNKNYPYLSKQAILAAMSKIVNNYSFNSQYMNDLRNTTDKRTFEHILPEAISFENYDYYIEAFYGDKDQTLLKYFEVAMPVTSSMYGDELPFELKGGKLVPLKDLEATADAIEKYLTNHLGRAVYRSMSSRYGATFINGVECILFGYCGGSHEEFESFSFNTAIAYDMTTGNIYYATGDWGGYKTTVPKDVRWQLLGVYSSGKISAAAQTPSQTRPTKTRTSGK